MSIRNPGLIRLVGILSVVFLLPTACRPRDVEQRYPLKGKVVNVDKRGLTVTVAHDAIPGYMEAMTMPFKLKDDRMLNDASAGDGIQATLVIAGLRSWLEDVVLTRETAETSNLARTDAWLEPKPGDLVPDFNLVDQSSRRFGLNQLRGQNLILTFIYTRCPLPDYCPLMTDNFAEIEKTLKASSDGNSKVALLSITLDPTYDTPEVLRQYAEAHSADLNHWRFATGTRDDIKKVATYFGLQFWNEGDQVVHSLRTALIGADGKLVKLYRGNEWKPDEVIRDLQSLTVN